MSVIATPFAGRSLNRGSSAVVTLSGESFILGLDSGLIGPWDSRSGIRVNTDGTIDKYTGGSVSGFSFDQIDSTTDWIIPNGDADSTYEFRLEVVSGSSPNFSSDSINTWISLTTGLQWIARLTDPAEASESWTWTLRVRQSGGAEIDSATYSGSNSNTQF